VNLAGTVIADHCHATLKFEGHFCGSHGLAADHSTIDNRNQSARADPTLRVVEVLGDLFGHFYEADVRAGEKVTNYLRDGRGSFGIKFDLVRGRRTNCFNELFFEKNTQLIVQGAFDFTVGWRTLSVASHVTRHFVDDDPIYP